MPAGAGRSRNMRLVGEYRQKIATESIPVAMSRLWLTGRPDKEGNDSRTGELLHLWGLNLERRRPGGFGRTYHSSINEFRSYIGHFYHEYLDELYYRRFIDIHGRLWLPATMIDGQYVNPDVGNLREFAPTDCENWLELSNWDTVLRGY